MDVGLVAGGELRWFVTGLAFGASDSLVGSYFVTIVDGDSVLIRAGTNFVASAADVDTFLKAGTKAYIESNIESAVARTDRVTASPNLRNASSISAGVSSP